jgi:Flp pilus assembly protein TadD
MQPESSEAHYQLAVIQGARKQTAAAIEHFQAAMQLNPDLVQTLSQLALIYATDTGSQV